MCILLLTQQSRKAAFNTRTQVSRAVDTGRSSILTLRRRSSYSDSVAYLCMLYDGEEQIKQESDAFAQPQSSIAQKIETTHLVNNTSVVNALALDAAVVCKGMHTCEESVV